MKRIIIGIMIFIAGFVGGLCAFLKWIVKFPDVLNAFKKDIVDKIEYLLLGYNTIKGPRKTYYHPPYYGRSPYSGYYTTSYRDYYGDKSFEEDEEEE